MLCAPTAAILIMENQLVLGGTSNSSPSIGGKSVFLELLAVCASDGEFTPIDQQRVVPQRHLILRSL
jgi:hypothetical protein